MLPVLQHCKCNLPRVANTMLKEDMFVSAIDIQQKLLNFLLMIMLENYLISDVLMAAISSFIDEPHLTSSICLQFID